MKVHALRRQYSNLKDAWLYSERTTGAGMRRVLEKDSIESKNPTVSKIKNRSQHGSRNKRYSLLN